MVTPICSLTGEFGGQRQCRYWQLGWALGAFVEILRGEWLVVGTEEGREVCVWVRVCPCMCARERACVQYLESACMHACVYTCVL